MELNSLIVQMCADRLVRNGDDGTAQVLARLTSPDGFSSADFLETLTAMSDRNPRLRMLSEYIEKMEASRRQRDTEITIEGTATTVEPKRDGGAQPDASAARDETAPLLELRAQVEKMFGELTVLREHNKQLATALGACPLCWGEDVECRSCSGRGAAGFSIPEPAAFLEYVVPAARMWKLQRSRVGSRDDQISPNPRRR